MPTTTNTYKSIKLNADLLTPIGIYANLQGEKKFLLESSYSKGTKGKFSFIGANPYKEIIGHNGTTTIKYLTAKKTEHHKDLALDVLKDELPKLDIDLPLPFIGGAVGYLGYDAIRSYAPIGEKLPDELDMPNIHLMLYKNIIVFDHAHETVYLLAINPYNETDEALDEQLEAMKEALKPAELLPITRDDEFNFEYETDKETFIGNVKKAQEYINNGETTQIVLSQRMKATMNGDPLSFYRKLRKSNPSPYMFFINFDDYTVLGASPESLIQTNGKQITTNPIAGTRPRGKTPEEDRELTEDLLHDPKELTEHDMLVDLGIDDFSKVCNSDSVKLTQYKKIEYYQHVMHIVSEVQGILNEDTTSIDALIAALPAGTVSGAPKVRAMQIINELETVKRGFYSGGVGFISFTHDLNVAIAIRSLVVKDKKAYIQAGAGIVKESIPEKEYMETLHKARSLMEANDSE